MTINNPLTILAALTFCEQGHASISLQKHCKKGNPEGQPATYHIERLQDGTFGLTEEEGRRLLRSLQKRRIHHHNQPEILFVINSALEASGLLILNNEFICTQKLIEANETNEYPTELGALAVCKGVRESLISAIHSDSLSRTKVYSLLFTGYMRRICPDIYQAQDFKPKQWPDHLTQTEAQIVADAHTEAVLPDGWNRVEADALWLAHRSGQSTSDLAKMLGVSDFEISSLCDHLRMQHRTAA